MAPHSNSDWLYVFQKEAEWFLTCGNALQNITASLNNPREQYPSTVLLIGHHEKEIAHSTLFSSHNNRTSRSLAQLSVDSISRDSKNPLFVASMDVDNAYSKFQPPHKSCRGTRHRVEWLSEQCSTVASDSLVDIIIGRLLLLFVDVVCVFLDDLSTPEEAIHLLLRWTEAGKLNRSWIPRVIFVTSRGQMHRSLPNLAAFGETRHVRLTSYHRKHPRSHRYRSVKDAILQSIDVVRKRRDACKLFFSATHLNVFFKSAVQHVANSLLPHFDFVTAARHLNPIDDQFEHHLQIYLKLCAANQASQEFILRYMASAIILDSLPPGTHHFKPREIFNTLYYPHLYNAFAAQLSEPVHSPTDWCEQLQKTYCRLYSELQAGRFTASQLHIKTLRTIQTNWSSFYSSQLCLFCLMRTPEHPLRCGHSICDICACIFGARSQEMEYAYQITTCILCQRNGDLRARIKPPTAGSRLLVLDGGGVRGAVTLQILQALDQYRKLPYPIYDEFDLALGTSTGGLIVLMFLLRRTIQECITAFKHLAVRVFSRHNRFKNSIFAKLYRLLSSLVTDSLYGAAEMEACVKEAFGADALLFGSLGPDSTTSGMKVAVTTMAVSNSRLCILSNYNGTKNRQGYKHYRPSGVNDEVLICEAARATSAAPSYFPAKFIRGLGFLQDGGAGKHNNPIDPAEWESKAIWDAIPDVVLSIGTGYARDPDSPQIISHRLGFNDRFFPRLFRLFSALLSAQDGWNDHLNRTKSDEKHKYFRINVALDKEHPLDDVDKIPEMEKLAGTFLKSYDFAGITRALFAASFFFELHQNSLASRYPCLCRGSIRCRSPDTRALVKRILEQYPAASFTTEDGLNLGYIKSHSLCAKCGLYCKDVTFKVCHLDQNVSIYIRFNRLSQHRISGFPQTISDLARRQLLDAEFGRPDHRIEDSTNSGACRCTTPNKRKRATRTASPTASPTTKRRRLS